MLSGADQLQLTAGYILYNYVCDEYKFSVIKDDKDDVSFYLNMFSVRQALLILTLIISSLNKCVHSDAQFYQTKGCWWLSELYSAKVRAC